MAAVTLADLREHLGLTEGIAEEDEPMLIRMAAGAQQLVESTLGYELDDRFPDGAPEAIQVAILQVAAGWYEHRESLSAEALKTIPFATESILAAFRDYSF